ncbi:MAG: TIGR03936 family radical SAM-associated protein [Clostridioides sp.]|jgi:radical SAM-linked protein|nr:TIGR03936 family radical SAM-associated protein [Clostridioides sp.]
MGKIIRSKFKKEGEMIYISHLDLQRLLQRAFRRAEINLAYSEGFNPHPKMSYGNALALGTESQGEYVDIEIADDITADEFLTRIQKELPEGIEFMKSAEIDARTPSLSSTIDYGEYIFTIELKRPLTKEFVKSRVVEFLNRKEIIISKINKKGKKVEQDIRPLIRNFDIIDLNEDRIVFDTIIATGSKQNLNTNIFIPMILDLFGIEMDPLDVDILRRDLYVEKDGEIETPF